MDDPQSSTLGRALAKVAHQPQRPADLAAITTRSAQRRRRRRVTAMSAALLFVAATVISVAALDTGTRATVILEPADGGATTQDPSSDSTGTATSSSSSTTEPAPTAGASASEDNTPAEPPATPPEVEEEPTVEQGEATRFEVTTRIEIIEATTTPPFSVDTTDPGIAVARAGSRHEVGFAGTDGTVYVTDPMFQDDLRYGDGRLGTAGRGCNPAPETGCNTEGSYLRVDEGQRNARTIELYTAELGPGTYVLEERITWARDLEQYAGPEGQAILRITYQVRERAEEPP